MEQWSMGKPYPSEKQERFIVRLPDGMRDQIAEAAKSNNRTMNAEVVSRLQKSFDAEKSRKVSFLRAGLNPPQFVDRDEVADLVDKRLSDFQEQLFDRLEQRFDASKLLHGRLKLKKS
jgi:hypothetical protein